ncbi:hypothetical protein AB0945_27945 [Streptomyces sp. NPDC005474]|uniref:hypothetical protein n=1 Tax=Streptomyces sp. NPDC005474 TaxID=3154878 RepID=UPI003454BFDB
MPRHPRRHQAFHIGYDSGTQGWMLQTTTTNDAGSASLDDGRDSAAADTNDSTTITELLAEFADRESPREVKMVGLPGDRKPTPEELHEAGEPSRFLPFRLHT